MNVSLIHLHVPLMLSARIQLVVMFVLVMLAILAMAHTAQVMIRSGIANIKTQKTPVSFVQ